MTPHKRAQTFAVNVLQTYEQDVMEGTGAEWVQCTHDSWLHEECIDLIEYDENGDEKLCSRCTSEP